MSRQTDDPTEDSTTDHPLLSNFDADDREQAHRDSVRERGGDGSLVELLTDPDDEQTDDEPTDGELFRRGDVFANEWKTLTVVEDGTDVNGRVKVKTDIGTTDRVAPRDLIELATDDTEVPGR